MGGRCRQLPAGFAAGRRIRALRVCRTGGRRCRSPLPACGDLVVLELDPDAISSEIRVEDSTGSGPAYPHVYGPIHAPLSCRRASASPRPVRPLPFQSGRPPAMISRMRVYLGSDHAGFELKAHLLTHLATLGYDVTDCGAFTYDAQDDYPPYCIDAATRTVGDPGSLGVVIGGSGNGEQMAANKVRGIRAALAWNDETAQACARAQQCADRQPRRARPSDRGRGALCGDLPGDAVLRRSPAYPPDRPARQLRGRRHLLTAGGQSARQCRRTITTSRSAAAKSSAVGRFTSRPRIAPLTPSCDGPAPTISRSPRSALASRAERSWVSPAGRRRRPGIRPRRSVGDSAGSPAPGSGTDPTSSMAAGTTNSVVLWRAR